MVALSPASPSVWVLHDGKPGMASQARGLAEATGFAFSERKLSIRRPWAWLPPLLWLASLDAAKEAGQSLTPPWPNLVIGCGRNTVRPALAIRRASGGRTLAAQIQDPQFGRGEFDMLFVPEHDRLRGPRIVVTRGAIHRVTPERLATERRRFPALDALVRPVLGVLIGGSNRTYRLDLRRTGEPGLAVLRERLAGLPGSIWDGTGANPYYAYLAIADALLVTADSVSMVSEAAATGKPVHIIGLDGGDAKFARFHETMHNAGITRPFTGEIECWSYAPPDDTARAGAALRELVLTHLAIRPPV